MDLEKSLRVVVKKKWERLCQDKVLSLTLNM